MMSESERAKLEDACALTEVPSDSDGHKSRSGHPFDFLFGAFRVLILNRDREESRQIRALLDSAKLFTTYESTSLSRAGEILGRAGKAVHVCICDPAQYSSRDEIYHLIRKSTDTRFIVLSGPQSNRIASESLVAGAKAFISRQNHSGFDREELLGDVMENAIVDVISPSYNLINGANGTAGTLITHALLKHRPETVAELAALANVSERTIQDHFCRTLACKSKYVVKFVRMGTMASSITFQRFFQRNWKGDAQGKYDPDEHGRLRGCYLTHRTDFTNLLGK